MENMHENNYPGTKADTGLLLFFIPERKNQCVISTVNFTSVSQNLHFTIFQLEGPGQILRQIRSLI